MKQCRGLTLIEVVLFIVIVSAALAGLLSVLNLTAGKSSDPLITKQGLAVAEAMLDEILAKDYQNDPGDAANASSTLGCTPTTTPRCQTNTPLDRPNYNDIDDFKNWNQNGVYQQDGVLAPILGNYAVEITVAPATLGAVTAKKVTVKVTGGGTSISLSGYRTAYE